MPRRTTKKPKTTPPGPQVPDTQTPEPQTTEIKRAAVVSSTGSKPKQRKRKADSEEDSTNDEPPSQKKKSRKRIAPDISPLAPRNRRMKMLVGAHVSVAKGVQNAITNSHNIGGNVFGMFLKSHRKWTSPDLKPSEVLAFTSGYKSAGIDPKRHILPHGSYLVNLAQIDEVKAEKGYDCFLDDLKRCEMLKIGLYNFHPGSTLGLPRSDALTRIAAQLNRAHKETKFVKILLENMAGQGGVVGANFEDLRDIIEQVKNKDRIGAAGHDIRTQASYDTVMGNFDRIVGQKYLAALHLNDSKAPLGANRDLHQNIGLGYLGLETFRVIMNDKRLEGLPMILETPMKEQKTWADEIKLLESLVGTKSNDPGFLSQAAELSAKGRGEREVAAAKTLKKAQKKVGKKQVETSDDEDEEEHACEH
ncbi:DNA-(apurinic or apyrimidinic site) lyase [Maublancomyces gigas]|uniref:DNA-(Apurinic or apyrimidinic site) lyase n=1 Tax=Discina gigas TaxID=1032678 RepID=A0ABR3GWF0_9PEZI